jgi:hypothetical protein
VVDFMAFPQRDRPALDELVLADLADGTYTVSTR